MRCGLLGEHLAHSYSPRLHALLGEYAYALLEIPPEALDAFLRGNAFDCLNVTIPYKTAVLPYCDVLSEAAQACGSVNTVLRRSDGTLCGDNTDCDGFAWLLERNGGIRAGEKVLLLGSGGAAKAVRHVLQGVGAQVVTISRSGADNYGNLQKHADAAMVVNATPVGMYPRNGEAPLSLAALPNCRCVLDLIYNPARTALLLEAEALGIPCEDGLPMLVAQAKRAAELFTGKKIPDARCIEILCKLRGEMRNLILIGMPGSGKSTVGKLLAARLNRPFLDADALLAERLGCSIPDFFAQKGEAAFRDAETALLADLGKRSGCVIATGGGCVTREENYPVLRQNGTIVCLHRALERLPIDGRPVSQSTPLAELYAARKALYARFADILIENDAAPETAVERILEELQ